MKTIIRLIALSLAIMFSVSYLTAQSGTKDVVYLKNGSIIKGTILEMEMDKNIKIQTADGSIFVYAMSEVDRITKESVPSNEIPMVFERGKGSGSAFVLYGGGALPLGDFVKDDASNKNAGFAKPGWLAGAQFVTGGGIGFLIDASYSSNPSKLDKIISDSIGNIPSSYNVENTAGTWSSFFLLAGIKIGTSNPSGANFFLSPVIGVVMTKTPDASSKISGSDYSSGYLMTINEEVSMSSSSKTIVVYGATIEAILGAGITIGARFIACKLKYDLEVTMKGSASYMGYNFTVNQTEKYQREPNISLAQLYLGFAF